MSNSYPVFTIADMARVPQEAWPRLIAELPALLAIAKPMVDLVDAVRARGGEFTAEQERSIFHELDWIDDDKQVADVRVTVAVDGKVVATSDSHLDISGLVQS